jgi:hypothetical protein
MSKKPRVLISVPCLSERGGWVNPHLAANLAEFAKMPNYDVTVKTLIDGKPWHVPLNTAVLHAKQGKFDWLLNIENDNCFVTQPFYSVLKQATERQKIITLPYPCVESINHKWDLHWVVPEPIGKDGNFYEVESGGLGGCFIHRDVWEKMPMPMFRTTFRDDETQSVLSTPDCYFFPSARAAGFKVWTHFGCVLRHFHTMDLRACAEKLSTPYASAKYAAVAYAEWRRDVGCA